MAKTILTLITISAAVVLAGCNKFDTGQAQIMPVKGRTSAPTVNISASTEVDLVEQIGVNREAYMRGLQALVDYYMKTGNDMKLSWAEKELDSLQRIPKYRYVVEAQVQGPDLRATTSIADADLLYNEAVRLQNQAEQFMIVKDNDDLRLALGKYNQLINQYPSSDKIDDAAFQAARIYEHFKDYTIAVLYYQRTYEWDPATPYPAMFKAAYLLDTKLHRRDEALQLYEGAVERLTRAGEHREWKEHAERRIRELKGIEAEPETGR